MQLVHAHVFVGDTTDAMSETSLSDHSISSMVCASRDHPMPFPDRIEYLYFPLLDDLTDNVLAYVDESYEFVARCVGDERNVLVHCTQGVSRSVALIVGYIMRAEKLDFTSAYDRVKTSYPRANMAENFQEQLRLYGSKFAWDMRTDSQAHRLYRARAGMKMNSDMSCHPSPTASSRYLCRKCKQCLCMDMHVLESTLHTTGATLPIECMAWMRDIVSEKKGDLKCPGCATKVGAFDWGGPQFTLTRSKIDEMPLHCRFTGEGFPKTLF
jgi:dual specificity phosphatase 12